MSIEQSGSTEMVPTVADMFPADDQTLHNYREEAQQVAERFTSLDPASPQFSDAVDQIREIGREEVSQTSDALEELLSRRVIPEQGDTPAITAANAELDSLRDAVVDLDPNGQAPRTFRGKLNRALNALPGGQKVRELFSGRESAGSKINDIAQALDDSRETLDQDIQLATVEMNRLWGDLEALGSQDARFTALADALQNTINQHRQEGRERQADALEGQALTALNARRQDVATHAGVVLNAYMTLKVLTETGKKLADSVYYARNTSITALHLVSAGDVIKGAQSSVANQVDMVRDVTSDLLVQSSKNLEQHTKRVNEQASKTSVNVDKLTEAFETTYGAIDAATRDGVEANQRIQAQLDQLNNGLAQVRLNDEVADSGRGKEGRAIS